MNNPINDSDFLNEFGERRRSVEQTGELRVVEYIRDMEVGDWLVANDVKLDEASYEITKYLKRNPPIGRTGYTFYLKLLTKIVTLYGY